MTHTARAVRNGLRYLLILLIVVLWILVRSHTSATTMALPDTVDVHGGEYGADQSQQPL